MDKKIFMILAVALLVCIGLAIWMHLGPGAAQGLDETKKVLSQDEDVSMSFCTMEPNAQFALYACRNTAENHVHDTLAATGSCWFSSGERYDATSDADGYVRFEKLHPDEYRLLETGAEPGHQRTMNQWKVLVNVKGVLTKMID